MRKLIIALVVIVVGVAALGYYEGWFQASTRQSDHKADLRVTIDKDKIRDDAERAKEEVQSAGKELIDKTKEGAHRLGRALEKTGDKADDEGAEGDDRNENPK
jgi:hypothetical protein